MNDETTTKRTYVRKPKIFGVFVIGDDGKETLIEYVQHYSTPQARAVALEGRITVREAGTDDLIAIGRDGIQYRKLEQDADEGQGDLYNAGQDQS